MIRYFLALPFWLLAHVFAYIGMAFQAVARWINPSKELP